MKQIIITAIVNLFFLFTGYFFGRQVEMKEVLEKSRQIKEDLKFLFKKNEVEIISPISPEEKEKVEQEKLAKKVLENAKYKSNKK